METTMAKRYGVQQVADIADGYKDWVRENLVEQDPQGLYIDPAHKWTDKSPATFSDGKSAAQFARALNQNFSHSRLRFKAVLIEDEADGDEWKAREEARFADGTYTPVPWMQDPYAATWEKEGQRYPHMSRQNPGNIAFIPSPSYGHQGRYVTLNAAEYAERYLAARMGPTERTKWASECVRPLYELLFATSADDIERVYRNGPNSCMAGTASQYSCAEHPVRAYASGDLAVAYLHKLDKPKIGRRNFRVSARTLVRIKGPKVYSRIYGDGGTLDYLFRTLLEEQGFKRGYGGTFEDSGLWTGAKVCAIPDDHGDNYYAVPYIDAMGVVQSVDGKTLEFHRQGAGGGTNGLGYVAHRKCGSCETGLYRPDAGQKACDDCTEKERRQQRVLRKKQAAPAARVEEDTVQFPDPPELVWDEQYGLLLRSRPVPDNVNMETPIRLGAQFRLRPNHSLRAFTSRPIEESLLNDFDDALPPMETERE